MLKLIKHEWIKTKLKRCRLIEYNSAFDWWWDFASISIISHFIAFLLGYCVQVFAYSLACHWSYVNFCHKYLWQTDLLVICIVHLHNEIPKYGNEIPPICSCLCLHFYPFDRRFVRNAVTLCMLFAIWKILIIAVLALFNNTRNVTNGTVNS